MPTAEKARTIEQAKEWYSKSVGVVFTDYRGLKVKEMQQLRTNLRAKGGELHVIKNTLFRVAAGEDMAQMPDELHNGTTAIAFVFENETDVTKALFDYARTNKTLKVKGGFFAGKAFNAKQVETLSELPPRDILLAQVVGAIAAPLTQLIGTIEALYADPIRVIGAVSDKVNEANPAPAAKPEAAAVVDEAPVGEAAAAPEPSIEEAPAADAEPEAATPPADQPAETSDDTNSTEAAEEASPTDNPNTDPTE